MSDTAHPQLALHLSRKPNSDFKNFIETGNEQILSRLKQVAQARDRLHQYPDSKPDWLYLWGGEQTGKSHLLLATCQLAEQSGQRGFFLDAAQARDLSTSLLTGVSEFDLVVVDDLDCMRGHGQWQEALFHLYNQLKDRGHALLVASEAPPQQIQLSLPDLISRLSAMEIYQLTALDDAGRADALESMARQRGFSVSEDVATYILNRSGRDLNSLKAVIERLDLQSLQEKRLITIPFVKKVMGW